MAEVINHVAGTVQQVNLSHEDIDNFNKGVEVAFKAIPVPELQALFKLSGTALSIVDKVGGNHGVTILAPPLSSFGIILPAAAGAVVTKMLDNLEEFVRMHPQTTAAAVLFGPIGLQGKLAVDLIHKIFGGGGRNFRLECDRTKIDIWEKFRLLLRPHNKFALLTYHNRYVCSDDHEVIGNRVDIGPQEEWTFADAGDGRFSIQAFDKWYMRADGGGGTKLVACDRQTVGPHEKFRFSFNDGYLVIRAAREDAAFYLSAQPAD